jgi:hypothetical protein
MIIDPDTHLALLRFQQQERDRGHLATHTADATPLTSARVSTPWQQILTARRRRLARGPTAPAHPTQTARPPAIPTMPPRGASSHEHVADGCSDHSAAKAPAPC